MRTYDFSSIKADTNHGRAPRQHSAGRRCQCGAKISIWNGNSHCFLCVGKRGRSNVTFSRGIQPSGRTRVAGHLAEAHEQHALFAVEKIVIDRFLEGTSYTVHDIADPKKGRLMGCRIHVLLYLLFSYAGADYARIQHLLGYTPASTRGMYYRIRAQLAQSPERMQDVVTMCQDIEKRLAGG